MPHITVAQLRRTTRLAANTFRFKNLQPRPGESICIANAEWLPVSEDILIGDLTIEFMQRGTYIYHEVPMDEYLNLAEAPSQGQYFNMYIRNAGYSYERIA